MSSLAEEGFIADQANAVIVEVRQQYAPALAELRGLNRILVRRQFGLNVSCRSAQHLACSALFVRALSHAQAAMVILERGMAPSGRAMVRCTLEAVFKLVACKRDYGRAVKFFDEDYVDRKRKAKYFAEMKDERARSGLDEALRMKMLTEAEAKVKELGASETKTRTMAQLAELEDLYLTAYAFLSGAVHSSAGDLEDQYVVGSDGNVAEMRTGPETERLSGLFLMLGEFMGIMDEAIVSLFHLGDDGETARRVAALQKLTTERTL
jgi:hypothetical protein